ncbi:hypothetical protein [Euzebya tangerina]|uniref:hypothetical protein n=1 Tax=Euzebya tangerina TaxID=591198 RepID=UPI000E32204B|nr:hypothetical protein [Euzebya tangerina]
MPILLTALLSSATTVGALYLLWRGVLAPDLERRAAVVVDDLETRAGVVVDDLETRAGVVVDDLETRAHALAEEKLAEAEERAQALADANLREAERRAQALADQRLDELERRAKDLADQTLRELEERAQALADEKTRAATEELTAAGEALIPRVRRGVRDGIQDALLTPPDRLTQTARDMTNVGVNVMESSLRRIFGTPPPGSSRREGEWPTNPGGEPSSNPDPE